jgi:F0F1-type ATP synthase membrane subunit c/vacuolar-type H+-ATPase subunit K
MMPTSYSHVAGFKVQYFVSIYLNGLSENFSNITKIICLMVLAEIIAIYCKD